MSKQLAKELDAKYMPSVRSQPIRVDQYVFEVHQAPNRRRTSVVHMFARLILILASRGILKAGEVRFIAEGGAYLRNYQYADWTPKNEHEDGLQPPLIRGY